MRCSWARPSCMFAGGLQGLLLSVRGAEDGFSLLALGLIGTGWSVGFIAGSITVPLLVQRVGHIRAFSIMAAIGTITILCNLLLGERRRVDRAARVFGLLLCGRGDDRRELAQRGGREQEPRHDLFDLHDHQHDGLDRGAARDVGDGRIEPHPFIVGAIAFICAILPSALTSTPQPRPLASAKLDVWLLYKTSPLAVIAAFSVGMANGTFGTLAPVYGYGQGLDAAGIAILFCGDGGAGCDCAGAGGPDQRPDGPAPGDRDAERRSRRWSGS